MNLRIRYISMTITLMVSIANGTTTTITRFSGVSGTVWDCSPAAVDVFRMTVPTAGDSIRIHVLNNRNNFITNSPFAKLQIIKRPRYKSFHDLTSVKCFSRTVMCYIRTGNQVMDSPLIFSQPHHEGRYDHQQPKCQAICQPSDEFSHDHC